MSGSDVANFAGVVIGLSVVGLVWAPMLIALRFPVWLAPAIAAITLYSFRFEPQLALVLPFSGAICAALCAVLFARLWRVQALVVLLVAVFSILFLLAGRWSSTYLALPIGFALGLFQNRSLQSSINRFALSAGLLCAVVICIHPGLWALRDHEFFRHYATPLLCLVLTGIGAQIGAGVSLRVREREARSLAHLASREVDALMGRMGWGVVPA